MVRVAQTLKRLRTSYQAQSRSTLESPWHLPRARTSYTVFDDCYSALAGSHRIQRVSDTEKRGRRHSSEVTVIVFDAAAPSRIAAVRKDDVRVDTFRASGAGGQHRNKTDSGVRLTHLPTGTVVTATEERSQHQNREVAWQRLRERLDTRTSQRAHDDVNAQRRGTLDTFRSWTWCSWRDEVKGPSGQRASMKQALAGKLSGILC